MQHKKQPQLCTRLFSRLRLQRRGCFSSSTSRKTTTTHHYHYLLRGGQEKQEGRPEAARRRRRRWRDVEWRGAALQPTMLRRRRLRVARRGGSTNIGASALRRWRWCCTLVAARHWVARRVAVLQPTSRPRPSVGVTLVSALSRRVKRDATLEKFT